MDLVQKILKLLDQNELIKTAGFVFIIAVCLLAMFSAPSMVMREPSSFYGTGEPSIMGILIVGLAIGCYGTIVGIGGGPLIVPFLLLVYGWGTEFLVASSLFVVFLNALSGTVGYALQRRIDYRGGLKFVFAAIPGAVISGFIHHIFQISTFSVIFGVFLILLAIYSLLSINRMGLKRKGISGGRKTGFRHVEFTDKFGKKFNFYSNDKLGVLMNLFLGFFIGFLGIGGGVFQMPVLVFLLRYPVHAATATSHFITMLTCAFAVLPHMFLGNVVFGEVMWMGLGVVTGAQLGARLAVKIKPKLIMYLFTVILLVFALRLLA